MEREMEIKRWRYGEIEKDRRDRVTESGVWG